MYIFDNYIKNKNGRTVKPTVSVVAKQKIKNVFQNQKKSKKKVSFIIVLKLAGFTCRRVTL